MASAKSSRSRAAASSGVIASAAAVSGGDDGVQLSDKLQIFKTDGFDPDGYVQSKCQTMSEKEIRHLCSYLQDLKKASAEEMRRSVYANYAAFIRTSKEISDLEGELLSIRNLLSTQVAVIHALADGVHIDSLSSSSSESKGDISNVKDKESSDLEKWSAEFPDILDVLLAERRVDEALAAFDEGEAIVAEAKEKKTLSRDEILRLQASISNCRQKLSDQLAEAACQSSTCGVELRAAASALKRLGDGPRGHSLILNSHYQRLKYNMQTIHPTTTSYGGAYTAALSQQIFSAIAQAVNDSWDVFGDESTYASELVIWATKQTEDFAHLVKRHALASSAAAGGLRAAAECVQIALGHCSLLEARGLALSSVLLKLFRPSVEQALDANLRRIEQSTAALAAADDWSLTYPLGGTRISSKSGLFSSGGMVSQPKLSSSAHRFYSMAQDFLEDVGPLLSMQLGGSTLEGLSKAFNSYIKLLISALPSSIEEEAMFEGSENKIVRIAESDSQQLALLANASLLAEELLPRAAMKLAPTYQASSRDDPRRNKQNRIPEQREWKKKLQQYVDGLKDNFCRQHALDLIFTEDGDCNLTADVYLSMDNLRDEPDWCPSSMFQELFAKLNRMASMATDMFVGRERFATLLLMRLTETVILWLHNDQSFWDDIEDAPRPLGAFGLQQFYLDMQFVLVFTSQGRYLSRNLRRVIAEIIEKAINAFSASGLDLNSVLPEDDWFAQIAQESIEKISGSIRTEDREPNSPTASVSALSMSSYRSHGST